MLKIEEIRDTRSYLNKAKLEEMVFILLSRDKAAPATIEFWINERIRLGENKVNDLQILSAFNCITKMKEQNHETQT